MFTKKSKYRNKKVTVDGIKFDSHAEATFYHLLKSMKKAKLIDEFELQKKFTLQDSFKFEGKTVRAITYVCDFHVLRNGVYDVIDVKGMETDVFKMKRKMFINKFGKDIIIVRTANDYLLKIKGIK